MKLSIVIPCFNEEDNIEKLGTEFFPVVESLIGSTLPDGGAVTSVEVVFVDDGSKDATYHALKTAFASRSSQKLPIKFEKHEVNRPSAQGCRLQPARSFSQPTAMGLINLGPSQPCWLAFRRMWMW